MKGIIKKLAAILIVCLSILSFSACGMEFDGNWIQETFCNHDYNSGKITREATCDRYGERTYTCIKCDSEKTERIDKIPHNYELTSTVEATCVEKGEKLYKCTLCGETKTEEIAMIPHNYELTSTVEATCVEKGEKHYKCALCGETKTEEIAMIPHNYELTSTVESTCAEKGERLYKCTLCEQTKSEEMQLLPHDYETREAIAATCTDEGMTESIVCKNCGNISSGGETIPALGHDIDKYGDACTVCGKQYLYNGYSLETPVEGEKIVGNWYRIYTTYYEEMAGGYVDTDAQTAYLQAGDVTLFAQSKEIMVRVSPGYVDVSSQLVTISGQEENGAMYVDVYIECAEFTLAMGEVTTSSYITTDSTVTQAVNCYRLAAASGACVEEHDVILFKEAVEPTCSEPGEAAIYVCLDCGELLGGEEIPATGDHEISEYRNNADYHWGICACGYEMEKIAHVLSEEYGSNEVGHWTICEVCGYEDAIVNHDSGEWTTVGEVGKDIKDVLKCSKCGYVINTIYLANVDENGQEIVVELNLNTTTSFNLQLVLGETVINQTGTTGIAGLFFNDELVMTMDEIAANEFMVPATIFGDATGEQILEFGLYTGLEADGDLLLHYVSIKFNIVR